jgi:hypothetical protein
VTRGDATARVLGAGGLLLAVAFVGMRGLGDLFDHARAFVGLFVVAGVGYALAVAWIVRRPPAGRGALLAIVGAGVAFRLILLPTAPTLSTDLYRYLWDGRIAAAGVSPYRYPPSAPELASFRDAAVYPRLNHDGWLTIYPPGAQLLFAAMARWAPAGVVAFKTVLVAFDLLTIGLLVAWLSAVGRPPVWVLVYAWHPLAVVEIAGSGHLDAVVLTATVAALWAAGRGREGWAGALVGGAALVKLHPLLLLAAVGGRRPGRAIAAGVGVVLAGYALYAGDGLAVLGSLGRYLTEEHFNPGIRGALEVGLAPLGSAGHQAARWLPLAALAGLTVAVARARAAPAWWRALWLIGGYLLATPNLFPWYALWIVPVLAVTPSWPWLYLSWAVGLTYVILAEPVWHLPAWVPAAEFGPLALGLALALRRRSAPEETVGEAGRHLAQGAPGQALPVVADEGLPPVGGGGEAGVERHAPEEGDSELGGGALAARPLEEGAESPAGQAHVARHVLDQAEERRPRLAGEDDRLLHH